jgi:hypothetical protein
MVDNEWSMKSCHDREVRIFALRPLSVFQTSDGGWAAPA